MNNAKLRIGMFNDIHSIGDNMVRLQGLFVLKKLYPQSELILFGVNITKKLFENIDFIDKIVLVDELGWEREHGGGALRFEDFKLDVLLLASSYKFSTLIKLAQKSKIKKIIAPLRLNTLFAKGITTCFYTQIHPHREVYRTLRLVRKINKKHFDANIKNIELKEARLKTLPQNKAYIDDFLTKINAKNYKYIVGINAFGNTLFKFEPKDFVKLAKDLAQNYNEVLFILMSYENNSFKFEDFKEPNLKVFVNKGSLLDLVEFTSHLTLLISPDTGNIHIADNQLINIFQTIRRNLKYQWGGGSYGNTCKYFVLPKRLDKFKKHYESYKEAFFKRAKKVLDKKFYS